MSGQLSFGFPIEKSPSLKNITGRSKTKRKGTRNEKNLLKKKFEILEGQKECLQMWKEEAEARNRKIMQIQLPFSCKKVENNEKQNLDAQRTPDSQNSSSLFQLAALKLDPDLDGHPPTQSPAPPPCNPAMFNERGQTDSTMPQGKTSLGAAHPDVFVPPQNPTIDISSPIAHRLRHPKKDADFTMPMVEVSGPEGPMLVFASMDFC